MTLLISFFGMILAFITLIALIVLIWHRATND